MGSAAAYELTGAGASVVGEVLKILALEGQADYDISAFDPGRFV